MKENKTDKYWIRQQDNLEFMKVLESESIDLIYCDVLFATGRNFGDYQDLKPKREIVEEHYLPRLKEMHRILKPTGSIYLQMDWRINHWVRCLMDGVFGYDNFRNEIIWEYGLGNNNKKTGWQDKHDNILFYSKSLNYMWNETRGEVTDQMFKKYCHTDEYGRYMYSYGKKYYLKGGKRISNVWSDLSNLSASSKERLNYQTQKPKALLERIIKASSNEGNVVADFYMGSGTTGEVALELNRKFIGCDIGDKAFDISKKRLNL